MNLGIIGGGTVGAATARAFAGCCEVRVYDVVPERRTHGIVETLDCDLVMVCLPTPQKAGSLECDTSIVEGFFEFTAAGQRGRNFVLRSTVPIGTTRRLREKYGLPNLIHSPEFLTARTADDDAANPVRNVIGGWMDDCKNCLHPLHKLYQTRFPNVPIYTMTSDESEAVKLFQNAFGAVKVSLFNEFRCLADKLNLDWHRVLEALLASGWIEAQHTQVPGPDGKRGFGGACFPKDLANLIHAMRDLGLTRCVCEGAYARNAFDRESA